MVKSTMNIGDNFPRLVSAYWSGTGKGHAGGEGAEELGGEVLSVGQETVARRGKKLRRWLRIESNEWISRRPYAHKIRTCEVRTCEVRTEFIYSYVV
jgi:hypothetical protein